VKISPRTAPLTAVLARAVVVVVLLAVPRPAWAHRNGIAAAGCDGCHSGGRAPAVTLSASPENPRSGDLVTLTVTVSPANGSVAGFYLTTAERTGTFRTVESGTATIIDGVTHAMPRTGTGGVTTFRAGWSSSAVGGVDFHVYALSANGDGTPVGDGGGMATRSIAVGCAGVTLYVDQDRDGFGTSDPAYPTHQDCAARDGYAMVAGDCDDFDPAIHPDAVETCNGQDDDCDGMTDEGVRPTCGLGWCRRYAAGCGAICTPGPPRVETCNLFDDDCDGVIDNGDGPALCGDPALTCVQGRCVMNGAASDGGASTGGAPAAGGAGGASASGRDAGASSQASSGCALAGRTDGRAGRDVLIAVVLACVGARRRPRRRREDPNRRSPFIR
jgi:hypothetical protein